MNIFIYSGIVATLVYLVLQRLFCFMRLSLNASKQIHERLLQSVIGTSLAFFLSNGSGRILNRFSKDIATIDTILPTATYHTINVSLCFSSTD